MVGVFGDIHGCYYTLERLYQLVSEKYPALPLYATGDLVDRGNFSSQVIDFVIARDIKPVLGNHECLFFYSFEFPNHPYREVWTANGNLKTLSNYSECPDKLIAHISYLKNLPLYYYMDDCLLTHAGISVLFQQECVGMEKWDSVRWKEFLAHHMHEEIGVLWNRTSLLPGNKLQVVGHTKHAEIRYYHANKALYIDTGAHMGNKLTCAIIDRDVLVEVISVPTVPEDILFAG